MSSDADHTIANYQVRQTALATLIVGGAIAILLLTAPHAAGDSASVSIGSSTPWVVSPAPVIRETSKVVIHKTSKVGDLAVIAAVEAAFPNDRVMWRIASCESQDRQFYADGTVFRGVINPKDVGVFQINEHFHLQTSLAMGMDIHSLAGNIAYAKALYASQGTVPWNWSASCWRASG